MNQDRSAASSADQAAPGSTDPAATVRKISLELGDFLHRIPANTLKALRIRSLKHNVTSKE